MMDQLPDRGIDVNTGKPARTSAGRFMGANVIYGKNGDHATPYMTRLWFGRLRIHIFHRGDQDPDCHDHPWPFWTFPLRSYVEEVVEHVAEERRYLGPGKYDTRQIFEKRRQIVRAFRLHYRPATHTHRVLGLYDRWGGDGSFRPGGEPFYPGDGTMSAAPAWKAGVIPTIVWRGQPERLWGFLKSRDGQWCWVHWKEYVFGGGKSAACAPEDQP